MIKQIGKTIVEYKSIRIKITKKFDRLYNNKQQQQKPQQQIQQQQKQQNNSLEMCSFFSAFKGYIIINNNNKSLEMYRGSNFRTFLSPLWQYIYLIFFYLLCPKFIFYDDPTPIILSNDRIIYAYLLDGGRGKCLVQTFVHEC